MEFGLRADGAAKTLADNLNLDLADFKQALALAPNDDSKASHHLALARAYSRLGQKGTARTFGFW